MYAIDSTGGVLNFKHSSHTAGYYVQSETLRHVRSLLSFFTSVLDREME